MEQLRDFADPRLITGCIYCDSPYEADDHVPSKVFLDKPFPENLPVVPSCWECNNGFSRDEEYVACVIEAACAGTADPSAMERTRAADILRHSPKLRSLIDSGKSQMDGQTSFQIDPRRVQNVVLKLARGHAAFELTALCREEPSYFSCRPLATMTDLERDAFDAPYLPELWGEVGSRSMQRISVVQLTVRAPDGKDSTLHLSISDWINVQEGRYRYIATPAPDGIEIRFVIREYLACEVHWKQ